MLNVFALTKTELKQREKFRCIHGHNGIQHPNCFDMQNGLIEKIGYFDIESSSLTSDFGTVLVYCIKHDDGIIKNKITSSEIKNGTYDKRLLSDLCVDLRKFDRIVTWYGCFVKGSKVLTSELIWKNAEDLDVGENLVCFDENLPKKGYRRRYKNGKVLHKEIIKKECLKISFDDGTSISCSSDHPFLMPKNKSNGSNWGWVEARFLEEGDNLPRIFDKWEQNTSYESGYISGFFDGEGSVSQFNSHDVALTRIGACQKENDALYYLLSSLSKYNVKHTVYPIKRDGIARIDIQGELKDKLSFLGTFRPKRLLSKIDINKLGTIHSKDKLKIIKIESIGEQEIVGLQTDASTYICEGFASHNSKFDIPFCRSRCILHCHNFPVFGEIKHTDAYMIAKRLVRTIHSKRLGVVADFYGIPAKGHPLKPNIWLKCLSGNKDAIDFVEVHCIEDVVALEKVCKKAIFPYTKLRATCL